MKSLPVARSLVLGLMLSLPVLARAEVKIPEPPAIDAKAWAILDYASGELIASSNAEMHVEPASITKVMTVYIAFDEIRKGRLKLGDTALVSEKAWRQGKDSSESRMFVNLGSRVSIEDLLRGIIVVSGNDASVVVAEHIAGSEDAFAQLMNQYAMQLGLNNSLFADASGVTEAPHYSSAHDLTLLGRALIHDFPEGYKIFSERSFKYGIEHAQENRNGLLLKDPSVDGIKTGHTSGAGYCLLASAQRDGRRYITAVMGAPSWAGREQASLELLNYAFRFYENTPLFGPASPIAAVKVYKGAAASVSIGTLEPVNLVLPRGARDQLQIAQTVEPRAVAPVKAGQKLGSAMLSLDGKPVRTIDLVALTDVDSGGFWRRLIDQIRLWLGW